MTELSRNPSNVKHILPRQQISRLAFLLAGLLIAVTSASLLFVGYVASQASAVQATKNEQRLFENTLSDKLRSIVKEQISVASSDASVSGLVRDFDPAYALKSFDTLWTDYAHSKVMLVSGTGEILAESFQDYTHIIRRPVAETPDLHAIVERVRTLYFQNRTRVPGGYGHRALQGMATSEYSVMGVVRIDGKPALFGAMPIIPDKYDDVTLPAGHPSILLSAHHIDEKLLSELNARLDFDSFRFVEENLELPETTPYHIARDVNDETLGTFLWQGRTTTSSIWPTVIPVIALLSVTLAALAVLIAWRIGKLTGSLQASEQKNRFLAMHDTLTGLANRLQFKAALEDAVKMLDSRPFAVIQCDFDRFKEVNDSFGHAAGDSVIAAVASRLSEVVGDAGLVSRIGGDEFMVIYHGPQSRSHLKVLCKALIESATLPVRLTNDRIVQIGLSVGIARAPQDGAEAGQLVSRSDAALYRSKNSGRGQLSFFDELTDLQSEAATSHQSSDGHFSAPPASVSH